MNTLPGVSETVAAVAQAQGLPALTVMVADAGRVLHRSDHGLAGEHDIWRLYSMTKLIGVLTTLKQVEAGRLSLDQPVAELAPEFDAIPVLDGMGPDGPAVRPQRTRATLGDLAHHRSGAAYGVWHEGVRAFMRAKGLRGLDDSSVAGLTGLPLAFDPGTGWAYGTGIDWLGLVIERATGHPVEDVVAGSIFGPADARDLHFALNGEARARLRPAHQASPDGFAPLDMTPGPKREFYPMGGALFGTAASFLSVLQLLLRPGALLSRDMLASLGVATTRLDGPLRSTHNGASADVDLLCGAPSGFGLGGLIALDDVPGRRRQGAFGWAGMQNTHFWVDPTAGIAAVILMQHLPFADGPAMAALTAFETAVYAAL